MRNTTGAPQSSSGNAVDDDTRSDRPSNTCVAAVGDTPSYSYIDCALLENPSENDPVNSQTAEPAMEKPQDVEIKEAKGIKDTEGLLYSRLRQGNAESNVVLTNEDDQDYNLLDRTEKKNEPRQYGDKDTYQHIQPQVTSVADGQDYQRLNRDAFR